MHNVHEVWRNWLSRNNKHYDNKAIWKHYRQIKYLAGLSLLQIFKIATLLSSLSNTAFKCKFQVRFSFKKTPRKQAKLLWLTIRSSKFISLQIKSLMGALLNVTNSSIFASNFCSNSDWNSKRVYLQQTI